MIIVGTIPEKITYFFISEKNINPGPNWNLQTYSKKKIGQIVTPSAVADSSDLKSTSLAIKIINGLSFQKPASQNHKFIIKDNLPIKNIKLFSLYKKSGGICTYKVLIDNFLVDIKEDVLVDSIIHEGAEPGGILSGDFIWAKFGTQLKLIRIGSELHESILEFNKKKDSSCIKKKELKIGGIYQTLRKDYAIYLGEVDTVWQKSSGTGKFNFLHKPIRKSMLFCQMYANENPEDLLKDSSIEQDMYRFSIKTGHKFIEKIDQIEIPKNLIANIREINRKKMKKYILKYSERKSQSIINYNYLEYLINNSSKLINMYDSNQSPVGVFDHQKYLILT